MKLYSCLFLYVGVCARRRAVPFLYSEIWTQEEPCWIGPVVILVQHPFSHSGLPVALEANRWPLECLSFMLPTSTCIQNLLPWVWYFPLFTEKYLVQLQSQHDFKKFWYSAKLSCLTEQVHLRDARQKNNLVSLKVGKLFSIDLFNCLGLR